MGRLVAAIAARDNRIAKLILGQAFAAATLECIFWTAAIEISRDVAMRFILAVRTLPLAVANAGPRDAFSTLATLEGLIWALLLAAILIVLIEGAFLVGAIAAIRPAVAHEEPANAHSRGPALERPFGATCRIRRTA